MATNIILKLQTYSWGKNQNLRRRVVVKMKL